MVGIVVVSHSSRLAEGVAELASELGGDTVRISAVGGAPGGGLGTDGDRVTAALGEADDGDGVIVVGDLGSAILTARLALEDSPVTARLVDAPLVEGVVSAALTASAGVSLDEVARAAEEAWDARKL